MKIRFSPAKAQDLCFFSIFQKKSVRSSFFDPFEALIANFEKKLKFLRNFWNWDSITKYEKSSNLVFDLFGIGDAIDVDQSTRLFSANLQNLRPHKKMRWNLLICSLT